MIIENTNALAIGTGGTGSITIDGGAITANLGPSSYSFNGRSIVVAGAGGTFRNDGGNLLTFGNISGSAPVVFESGTGTIVTNSNTYSGGTTIKPGARIAYTSGTGFGSGPVTIQGGSLRSSQGTPQTVGNDVTLAGNVTFNASGTNVDNNLVFTGPMTLSGGDHTIDVSMSPRPGATGIFFNGVIGDGVNTHGFTKAGPGTLVLAGANTYGGATTVSAGTLLVNGDQSAAAGAVSVASGATLGGSGTLGGATTISGIHSPGNSPGVQTFASDLSYTGGSASVVWELTGNTSTQGSPTAVYDQIVVGGNLDFAAVTSLSLVFNSSGSTVDWSNEFWGSDKTWTLYDVAGTTSNLGNFTIQPDTWLDSTNAALATIRPNAAFSLTPSGEDVLLSYVAVPEPESMAAVAAGLAALAAAFRRRRTAQTA